MKQAIRTPAQNRDFWLARAAEYEREAARHVTVVRNAHWLQKAADAREKAASYEA